MPTDILDRTEETRFGVVVPGASKDADAGGDVAGWFCVGENVAISPEPLVPNSVTRMEDVSRLVAVSPGSSVLQKICVVVVWPFPAKVLMSLDAEILEVVWAAVVCCCERLLVS